MGDLSLHVDATHNWNYAQEIIRSPAVHSIFLMNASPDQVSYALQHCDFVVIRIFDPFNEYQGGTNPDFEKTIINHNPQDFVSILNDQGFDRFKFNKKCRFVVGWNELYAVGGEGEAKQNQKMVDIATALVNAGYGVGMGCWASDKSLNPADINAGHWDNILLFAVQHKDYISLDLHCYTVTRTANQHLKNYPDGFPDTLSNPSAMQPSNFGEIDWNITRDGNFHIGRPSYLMTRSLNVTGEQFEWYRGECAHDFKDDGAYKTYIDNVFIPQWGRPSGINTLMAYYAHLNGGSITNERYNEMLIEDWHWLISNDPPNCKASFVFAHNGSSDWVDFNTAIDERRSAVQWIMQNEDSNTPPPIDPPEDIDFEFDVMDFKLYRMRSNTGGNVRVRNNYGLNSVILNEVIPPEEIIANLVHPSIGKPDYPPVKDGWTWVYTSFVSGIEGWSAFELIDEVPFTDPDFDCKKRVEELESRLEEIERISSLP